MLAGLGALGAAGLAWLVLAPASLGGVLSASAVSGASMDPAVRSGDLVILETRDRYHPGEIVAYRNRAVAHTFLHRIVRIDGGRILLRGDRNGWLDPGRTRQSDIAGAMLLRVPRGGLIVTWLQVPLHGALVAAVVTATAALAGGGAAVRRRRRRRRTASGNARERRRPRIRITVPPAPTAVAVVAGLALAGALAGSAALWTMPVAGCGRTASVRQSAGLTYAADVPPSAAYPDGRMRTGDPVYLAIVRGLDLAFEYRVASTVPHRLRLAAQVTATVSDGDGWRHDVPLPTSSERRGDTLLVRARLDLAGIRRLLAQVQSLTGVAAQEHALAFRLRASASGELAGRPLRTRLVDAVGMRLDPFQLHTGAPRLIGGVPRLAWRDASQRVRVAKPQRRRLSAAGVWVTVPEARAALAVTALVAALALVLAASARAGRPRPDDDAALAEARHGRMIVPLAGAPALPSAPIDVGDMRSLVRIARRYDAVILHHAEGGADGYLVVDGDAVYRFTRGTPTGPPAPPPPPSPPAARVAAPETRGQRLLHAVLAASRSTPGQPARRARDRTPR